MMQNLIRSYIVISPTRDEQDYMRRTLDSVIAQTERPTRWIIVDDGSTDDTPRILAAYAAKHDWITVVTRKDRGGRAVGPGVVDAFYAGLAHADLWQYTYVCKLDMDLDLKPTYFSTLMDRMEKDPRIGTASGKPYYLDSAGNAIDEGIGDEMSVGASKFMRVSCFNQIGGFVREVMWDGIDCHKARLLGWRAISWADADLRFEHLRPMGSSQVSIWEGRRRHGYGQYYMGTHPLYFAVACVNKMRHKPYILGSLASAHGYIAAWWRGDPRHDDKVLRRFIRGYQLEALLRGKPEAVKRIEAQGGAIWSPDAGRRGPMEFPAE